MAHFNESLDDLSRSIEDIVDRAVSSQNYQKLNQTIRQTVDQAVNVGTETVRRVKNHAASVPTHAGVAYGDRMQSWGLKDKSLALYKGTGSLTAVAILQTVFGGLLTGITGVALLFSSIVFLVTGGGLPFFPALFSLMVLAAGGGLLGFGLHTLNWLNRFKTYRGILGQKTYCALEALARSVGKSEKYVRKDVLKMISQGLFLQGHLDKEGKNLITSHETYQLFEQSRLQLEHRQQQAAAEQEKRAQFSHAPQVQEVLDRGSAFITQIQKCNDDIPGVEISEKISRMELIVRRIFDRAMTNPEVIPDLKKLMDYYLPMTVKLLNAYADMDAQPVQGETILASKREIEATLDTLNLAYEKLLDELFADTALDVSSDISVLNTLLAQEGLTEDDLSKLKNKHNL